MEQAVEAVGHLFLDSGLTTPNTTIFNTGHYIPRQVLTLKEVSVQFSGTPTSGVIYVDLPFLSSEQMIDDDSTRYYLPIRVNPAEEFTMKSNLNIPLYVTRQIDPVFTMYVRDADGVLLTDLERITLEFSYPLTSIK